MAKTLSSIWHRSAQRSSLPYSIMVNAKDMIRQLREEAKAKKALSNSADGESSISMPVLKSQPQPPQPPATIIPVPLPAKEHEEIWQKESLFERKVAIEGGMGRGRGSVLCLLEDPMGTLAGGNGAKLWDCSLALTRFLAEHYTDDYFVKQHGDNTPNSVLELGAGLGLVGMALATMGANVVATERALALPLLTKNMEHNQGVIIGSERKGGTNGKDSDNGGSIQVAELSWGHETTVAFLEERDRREQPPFDIVVGSDLIFPSNVEAYPLLVDTLHVLLRHRHQKCNANGKSSIHTRRPLELWQSHEPRRPEVEQQFWTLLQEQGIHVHRLTKTAATVDDGVGKLPSNHPEDIMIFKLSLKDEQNESHSSLKCMD